MKNWSTFLLFVEPKTSSKTMIGFLVYVKRFYYFCYFFTFDFRIGILLRRCFGEYVTISIWYSWKNFQDKICCTSKTRTNQKCSVVSINIGFSNTLGSFRGCSQWIWEPSMFSFDLSCQPFFVKKFPPTWPLSYF